MGQTPSGPPTELQLYATSVIQGFKKGKRAVVLMHGLASSSLKTKISMDAGIGLAPDEFILSYVNLPRILLNKEQFIRSLALVNNDGVLSDHPGVEVQVVHGLEGISVLTGS